MKFLALVFLEHLKVESTNHTGVNISVFIIRTNLSTLTTFFSCFHHFRLGSIVPIICWSFETVRIFIMLRLFFYWRWYQQHFHRKIHQPTTHQKTLRLSHILFCQSIIC